MVSIVRYNRTIVRTMEEVDARRRFRVRKVLAERAHVRPLRKPDCRLVPVLSSLRSRGKS